VHSLVQINKYLYLCICATKVRLIPYIVNVTLYYTLTDLMWHDTLIHY